VRRFAIIIFRARAGPAGAVGRFYKTLTIAPFRN